MCRLGSLAAGVVVEGKLVDTAAGNTRERTRSGDGGDVRAERLRGLLALGS